MALKGSKVAAVGLIDTVVEDDVEAEVKEDEVKEELDDEKEELEEEKESEEREERG